MKCGTDVQQDMAKINSADFASRRNRRPLGEQGL